MFYPFFRFNLKNYIKNEKTLNLVVFVYPFFFGSVLKIHKEAEKNTEFSVFSIRFFRLFKILHKKGLVAKELNHTLFFGSVLKNYTKNKKNTRNIVLFYNLLFGSVPFIVVCDVENKVTTVLSLRFVHTVGRVPHANGNKQRTYV